MIELVIVLFLTGVILFMVGQLVNRTFVTLRFLQEKAEVFESATLGLERLSSEFREAVSFNGVPLSFDKVNPAAPAALGNDLTADPSTWKDNYSEVADGANHIGTVIYEHDTSRETLTRTVLFRGQSQVVDVATNVNDFTVERAPTLGGFATGNNVFRIRLSLQEQRRVRSFETVLTVPGLSP